MLLGVELMSHRRRRECIETADQVQPAGRDSHEASPMPLNSSLQFRCGIRRRSGSIVEIYDLIDAAKRGDCRALGSLVSSGMGRRENGWNALMIAASEGEDQAVSILLGLDREKQMVHEENEEGRTALLIAAGCGY